MQEDRLEKTGEQTERKQFTMPSGMSIGPPVIRVRDASEALSFYEGKFGLHTVKEGVDSEDGLELTGLRASGADRDLLRVKTDPSARAASISSAGLYHFAILVPSRKSLGHALYSLNRAGVSFEGFADHTVSESLYLQDPERNGIEIYADRGKETWKKFMELGTRSSAGGMEEWMAMNRPLDIDSLIADASGTDSTAQAVFPAATVMGHMHLKVTDLSRSVNFYSNRLGLDITAHLPSIGAAFLSAGGYHHHVGLNTWHTMGGSPRQRKEAGLDSLTITVPDSQTIDRLRTIFQDSSIKDGSLSVLDPDGIRVTIQQRKS